MKKNNTKESPVVGGLVSKSVSETESQITCVALENPPFDDDQQKSDLENLANEINDFHNKAENAETDALKYAWEAGHRLEQAFEKIGFGGWGEYCEKHFSSLGRTTIWRYRKLGSICETAERLSEFKTITAAYQSLSLVKLEEEPYDETPAELDSQTQSPALIKTYLSVVSKASNKFSNPSRMKDVEKAAVKNLCKELEKVCNTIEEVPSIPAVSWREKIDQAVSNWTPGELELFRAEFTRLQAIHQQLQPIVGGQL